MTQKKILIVEDDMDIVRLLATQLRSKGYKPLIAMDGAAAIRETRQNQPALILLDLGLPAGDGFTVMGRLQNIMPLSLIPIIVISAWGAAKNEQKALQAGAFAYLSKPVDSDKLLALIAQALGE